MANYNVHDTIIFSVGNFSLMGGYKYYTTPARKIFEHFDNNIENICNELNLYTINKHMDSIKIILTEVSISDSIIDEHKEKFYEHIILNYIKNNENKELYELLIDMILNNDIFCDYVEPYINNENIFFNQSMFDKLIYL